MENWLKAKRLVFAANRVAGQPRVGATENEDPNRVEDFFSPGSVQNGPALGFPGNPQHQQHPQPQQQPHSNRESRPI